jgi:hypothetical protein
MTEHQTFVRRGARRLLGLRAVATLLAATGAIALLCSGCGGSGRSTAAFCKTMNSEQHHILAQFHAETNGNQQGLAATLDGLGATVEAVSALQTYFAKLADVAPPSIEDQAKIVAKSYSQGLQDEASQASNPLGALMSGLMDSADSSSQLNDVNQFALRHCGHSV